MPIELYERAWSMLSHAVIDRRSPFHLGNIATIGVDGRPKVRTVVLRAADEASRTIRFHTDGRSQKVRELAANPFVEAHFYDQPANIQIRLSGVATVEGTDQPTARQAWAEAKAMSKVCYRLDAGPGSELAAGDGYGYLPYQADGVDPGEVHFRTVIIKVDRIEVVVLKINANRRAVFDMGDDTVIGRWVVP